MVLLRAHKDEGGYRPITGVPFDYTYGMHVYDKGAVVAHNMRTYLGDSLFRVGLQAVQEQYKFNTLNSVQYRDALSKATGVDMTNFFNAQFSTLILSVNQWTKTIFTQLNHSF